MTQATDGILVYGYALGGPDEGWQVQETGEYGELAPLDWYDEEDDGADFETAAGARLLTVVAGFTEQRTQNAEETGYHDRLRDAEARVGVRIEGYCSNIAPQYALAAHVTTVARGHVEPLDLDDLTRSRLAGDWDDQLNAALAGLGLTPLQDAAGWLLLSYGEF